MFKKILIVGGTWNEKGGMPSSTIKNMKKIMNVANVHNGGDYYALRKIVQTTPNYDYVFWFANIEDERMANIGNVKDYAPKCLLITSKRNDNYKKRLEDLLEYAITTKSNLFFEFSKQENKKFNIRVFDPLGCVWYYGTDLADAVKACLSRLAFLSNLTRKPTIHDPYTDKTIKIFNKDDVKFFGIIKESSNCFKKLMCSQGSCTCKTTLAFDEPTRCMYGFPGIRTGNTVFLSKRIIGSNGITEDDYVPCFLNDDGSVRYGNEKPSIDAPVQLKLFKEYHNIDYILHGHVYIKDAPITEQVITCGTLETVDEILKYIDKNTDFAVLNLKGHGCIILSSTANLDKMKEVTYVVRPIPEILYRRK